MPKRERMSAVDAAWLGMEDPTNLMMITGVMLIEEPVELARLKEIVLARMADRFPRFRKKIVKSAIPFAPTYWEEDVHFNIDSHVSRVALPAPGDQETLQELVSDMMSMPLDFSRPPWHLMLIENYGEGCALFCRLHHAIADGIALMQVLLSLTDNEPYISVPAPDEMDGNADPINMMSREMRAAAKATQRLGDRLINEGTAFLADPTTKASALTKLGFRGAAALGKITLLPEDSATVFRGKLGVRKRAAWSLPLPLADVKALCKVTGGTINDVLLTAMAGAIGRYLRMRDSEADNIRAFVPVNLRPFDAPLKMGNKFGLVILSLPVGIEDPLDRLLELKKRMDEIKNSPEAVIVYGVLNALGLATQSIEDFAVEFFGKKATAVMTNVPGPREKIYMAGAPVQGLMFWVPQSGRLGLGVSIFSYNGEVTLGVAVDEGLVPDPDNIIEAFHVEFDSMMELVRHAALDSAETAPAPPPPVALATAAAPTAVVAVEPDDLTRIKGIGPKTAAALNEKEVTTFAQLSTMTPDAIRALLDESTVRLLRNIDSWPTQAAALDVIKTAQALP